MFNSIARCADESDKSCTGTTQRTATRTGQTTSNGHYYDRTAAARFNTVRLVFYFIFLQPNLRAPSEYVLTILPAYLRVYNNRTGQQIRARNCK